MGIQPSDLRGSARTTFKRYDCIIAENTSQIITNIQRRKIPQMSPKTEQNNLLMLASLATSLYEKENNSGKKQPKMMSFRTFRKKDFTCELCGFEPKTKNKYREKQDHLMNRHFKKQIDQLLVNNNSQKKCPTCDYEAGDRQSLLRHYTAKHGILEKLLSEALEEKNIDDEMKVENNRGGTKRKLLNDDVISADEDEKTVPKKLALSTLSNNNFSPKVLLLTNSKIQPKPSSTTTNILPQNTNVPLVIHSATNVEIPRKILPAPPPTFKVPMVPSISKKARLLSPKLKFQCQQCSKSFLNNRDLTRHAVVHTQEKNFKCSFCTAAFFGRKDHLVRHEQNCLNKNFCIQSASKLMSPGGSEVQSFIRIRPLNQLMPSSLPKSEEEPIEEFNHPISDDPYIPTILDPTYYPSVEEPEIHLITSEETNIVEEKSIDQQKIIENEVLELHSFPSTNNSQWSGTNRVHSVIPTIIDDVDGNYDQEEPLNFVIGEKENEDLELVIDEDFSSDVQNDINDDDERNICLHIPLKKRGKFSCNNYSLRKELKNVYTNMYSEKNI